MTCVKIFEEKYMCDLEKVINDWLRENKSCCELVDIKYSGCGYSVPYGDAYYSAMIIYKTKF